MSPWECSQNGLQKGLLIRELFIPTFHFVSHQSHIGVLGGEHLQVPCL